MEYIGRHLRGGIEEGCPFSVADVCFGVDVHITKDGHSFVGGDFNFKRSFDSRFILI